MSSINRLRWAFSWNWRGLHRTLPRDARWGAATVIEGVLLISLGIFSLVAMPVWRLIIEPLYVVFTNPSGCDTMIAREKHKDTQ